MSDAKNSASMGSRQLLGVRREGNPFTKNGRELFVKEATSRFGNGVWAEVMLSVSPS